jgi:hypothetical protein
MAWTPINTDPFAPWDVRFMRALTDTEMAERDACAALVLSAGCQCHALWSGAGTRDFDGEVWVLGDEVTVKRHDSACPVALAAAIERRGEE